MTSRNSEMRGDWCVARESFRVIFLLTLTLALSLDAVAYERRSPVVEAVEKVGPAVVNIRTEQIVRRRSSPFFGFGDTFFDDFFNRFAQTRTYRTQALGSGVIIDPNGYLLTNAHVVEKASKIYVALLGEQKEREATLVGIDPPTDLAVIKVDADIPLTSLRMGRSDDLMLGETVIAIGNPLGLENSVTTGVVSAPKRRLPGGEGGLGLFVQTDALINPGNSGGPLININGELIGINTAIAEQAQGIGFAIPVDVARRIAADLIEHGRVRSVYTGIIPGEISSSMVRSRGAGGVLVTEVDPGSPADSAGLEVADVVLGIDDVQVDNSGEFVALMRTHAVGSRVVLTVLRGTEIKRLTLKTERLPEGYAASYAERLFGLVVNEDRNGILIESVIAESPAAGIELVPGDRIAQVAGVDVETVQDFYQAIEENLGRLPLRFLVVRRDRGYLVELP